MRIGIADRMAVQLEWRPSGCREWIGALNQYGYGVIFANGKKQLAHRMVWELERGPIPSGLFVCHTCDNRRCCAIEHLFLGTPQENTADKVSKGRQAKGERCRRHTLTF